jgi:2-polyprenyl-3-methyl-5-hydroxy-6-metoxy-1,4-benzoquinol methylase
MTTEQQAEALDYFKRHADDWQQKAKTLSQVKFNVIQARNHYALAVIKERDLTRSALDVGCGTGDLVCAIARLGIPATGVDFAEDMIELAKQAAGEQALSQVDFRCSSIFDLDLPGGSYDAIIANGFIEYISQDELHRFVSLAVAALAPGGSLVLGSRNRLFNLYSLNAYTRMELAGDDLPKLVQEAVVLSSAESLATLPALTPAAWQAPETEHARTNIGVATRFQYTPFQLIELLAGAGLTAVEVCPVHIHGVPPSFKGDFPQVHTSIANLLQSYARYRLDLVPAASTFMIHARKETA